MHVRFVFSFRFWIFMCVCLAFGKTFMRFMFPELYYLYQIKNAKEICNTIRIEHMKPYNPLLALWPVPRILVTGRICVLTLFSYSQTSYQMVIQITTQPHLSLTSYTLNSTVCFQYFSFLINFYTSILYSVLTIPTTMLVFHYQVDNSPPERVIYACVRIQILIPPYENSFFLT